MELHAIQESPAPEKEHEETGQLIEKARLAAGKAVRANDKANIYDGGDRWFVEFRGHEGTFGGGARVSIAKRDLHVIVVTCGQ
jgi:hypothetical protein